MLSSQTIAALVAAQTVTYGVGDRQRRENAREAVNAGAEELGLDPLAPSLPRFAAGEDLLRAAALPVLKVPGARCRVEQLPGQAKPQLQRHLLRRGPSLAVAPG
jgi:hypothetical protein